MTPLDWMKIVGREVDAPLTVGALYGARIEEMQQKSCRQRGPLRNQAEYDGVDR